MRSLEHRALVVIWLAGGSGCNALVGIDDVTLDEAAATTGSTAQTTASGGGDDAGATTSTAASSSGGSSPVGTGGGVTGTSAGGGEGGSGGGGGAQGGSGPGGGEGGSPGSGGQGGGEGGGVPATCSDGRQSRGETDVDCGGLECPPCDVGDDCGLPGDCASGVCSDALCAEPTCDDGVANGDELGVDCGFAACGATCRFGERCESDEDCGDTAQCEVGRCAPTPIGVWVQGQQLPGAAVANPPGHLQNSAMFYDASRGWSVQFGGFQCCDFLNDSTWAYGPGGWFDLAPNLAPSRRVDAMMTYDRARSRGVLFGGSLTRETWEWDSASAEWELVDSGQGDGPARTDHKILAYDEKREVSVMYGGNFSFGELWEWDGTSWESPVQGGIPPTGRYMAALAWHGGLEKLVMFGGNSGAGNDDALLGDTWSWDGDEWVQLVDDGDGPTGRDNTLMAYDVVRDRIVLFGGYVGSGNYVADTWELDGEVWSQITTFAGSQPPVNEWGTMVYDEQRRRIVMLRGNDRQVWEYFTLASPCESDDDCGGGSCQDNLCCNEVCDDDESCATEADPGYCNAIE